MRMLSMAAMGLALVAPAMVRAQNTDLRPTPVKATTAEPEFSFGQMTPTPDMWLYQQAIRRYSEPRAAARRRAEFDADQRQARLAAQRWFGFSASRPTVNPTPFTGLYSPMWTSNSPYAAEWRGVNPATTIVAPIAPVKATAAYGLW